MRASNPVLNEHTFEVPYGSHTYPVSGTMTVEGTINKTLFLLALVVMAASVTWNLTAARPMEAVVPWVWGGVLGGFLVGMVINFKRDWAAFLSPIYALLKGFALGVISSLLNARYPGIAMQAVVLTFGVMFGVLSIYRSGLIKVTEKFKAGLIAATIGVMFLYLGAIAMRFFGMQMPFLHDTGALGIGVSLVIIVIAALNFLLDFDYIDQGVRSNAPKALEWFAAFGLIVTLVWLYIEILRLLSKLRSR